VQRNTRSPEFRPAAEDAWRGDYHDFTGIDARLFSNRVMLFRGYGLRGARKAVII
jgi:hypothetical protein